MSMELTKRLWEQPTDKGVLAYHIIQSFSPGEATPDQVHEIGCEFARRFLADRFECTVSTHLDKGHLHNHNYGIHQQTRRRLTLDLKPGSGSSNLQTSAKIQRIKICTRPLRRLRPRR